MVIHRLKRHFLKEKINDKTYYFGGLDEDTTDERDFTVGFLGLFDYKPKYDVKIIRTQSIKDQVPHNICGWCSVTAQKEVDEGCQLSVRGLVQKGKEMGLIRGDGFSNLRDNQRVVQQYGIPEADRFWSEQDENWSNYSRYMWNSAAEANAYSHRSQSFWQVTTEEQIFKALDEDRPIATGIEWFSGYNMGGGFKAPWIINKQMGYSIGGHAFLMIGYRKDYRGYGLTFIFQQSAGGNWGDEGKFYIPVSYFMKNGYSKWIQLDIEVNTAKVLRDYDNKFVKCKGQSPIYLIQDGKKKPFSDMISFFAWGGARKGYESLEFDQVSKIPFGELLTVENSPYYNYLKNINLQGKDVMNEIMTEVDEAIKREDSFLK